MNKLYKLHEDVETRVNAIRDSQSDWLCRQGCDGCCRRLAEVPKITAKEWDLLQEGLSALPPEQLMEISQKVAELAVQVSRPIVCPMLDRANGACLVYAQRLVACRTFGFYVQRELGLYCKDIETRVTDGALAEVVWGNHDIIDRRLRDLGESRDLTEWFAGWKGTLIEIPVSTYQSGSL
ncbi:MAG: YkgJ family cysteine cluster protein [Methylococcaceae bacterium]|nr:YkgJ family cysteine cluster protein [Methylococcaceae bacterium]